MKDRKRQLENLAFYDKAAIEDRAAHMAEKGWLVEQPGPYFWKYRRIEPKRLAVNVVYFPKASEFDPSPTEGQIQLEELCKRDGWILAARWGQMQIFYNEQKDPVPIETDPVIQVETVRAAMKKTDIIVRNPNSTRPFQHVLEPLAVYMAVAKAQYEDGKYAGYYNVGPDDKDCVTTGQLVDLFCEAWGDGLSWINQSDGGPHEANFLKLDCSRVKRVFGWTPRWGVKDAIRLTVEWCREYEKDPADPQVTEIMDRQIGEMFQSRGL